MKDLLLTTTLVLVILAVERVRSFSPPINSLSAIRRGSTKATKATTTTTMTSPWPSSPWCLGATLDGKSIDGDIIPTNNMVLLKLANKDQATSGGLLLSAQVKTKSDEGTIMSCGPGKINQESGVAYDMPCKPGENVIFNGFGTDLNLDGEKCMLVRDDDILVKYEGERLNLETAEVLRDNVLVKVQKKKKEEESMGGILLAQSSAQTKPTVGEVIKVGKGRYAMNGKLMEMDVQVGDMIKFRDLAGGKVQIDEEDYTVVKMSSIFLKF